MNLCSMTGYARVEGRDDIFAWVWEVRSVNGKGLDLRLRVPSGWERLDPVVRAAAPGKLTRGSVTVHLDVRQSAQRQSMQVNQALLDELVERCRMAGEEPRLDRLLTVRGVVEAASDEDAVGPASDETRVAAVQESLGEALSALVAARAEEGARIGEVLVGHLERIASLVERAATEAAFVPERLLARFKEQVTVLLEQAEGLPEDRLAQEAAALAVKADAREELDRLGAHIDAARSLLADAGPVGRKLDFLCQELTREANTLCAKANDLNVTRIGLDLKSAIEQFREQVQNLE